MATRDLTDDTNDVTEDVGCIGCIGCICPVGVVRITGGSVHRTVHRTVHGTVHMRFIGQFTGRFTGQFMSRNSQDSHILAFIVWLHQKPARKGKMGKFRARF